MSGLATVQKIIDIQPIEGADKIVTAFVLGWQVVIKKDEFKVGDLVCYIQIDTIVPETEQFEFLRDRKFRVRTIKLRKQISQGLIIPVSTSWKGGLCEGDDVTGFVGVKKYEKVDNNPLEKYEKPRMPKSFFKKYIYLFKYNFLYKALPNLRPKLRSSFPTHLVSITDEERIQNIPHILKTHVGKEFSLSYKLDGSSITIIHSRVFGKSKFRICSRRFELHDKRNDWYKVFEQTKFKDEILKLVKQFRTNDIIIQGEAIGKFNGNHHNLQSEQIRVFNIYVNGRRLKPNEFYDAVLPLNIPHCPKYKSLTLNHDLQEVLSISEIKDKLNPNVEAEGLVWRCVDDGTSFKVINNKYLLNEK